MPDPKGNLVTPVGFRSDGSIHALELNDSDHVKVELQNLSDELFLSPVGGVAVASNSSLAAGTSTLSVYTVPAGQRIILKNLAAQYTGTVAGVRLLYNVSRSGTNYYFQEFRGITSGQMYGFACDVVLEAGDIVGVTVTAATLNDDISAWVIFSRVL